MNMKNHLLHKSQVSPCGSVSTHTACIAVVTLWHRVFQMVVSNVIRLTTHLSTLTLNFRCYYIKVQSSEVSHVRNHFEKPVIVPVIC